jgi:predicted metal-dependent hydrolase
LRFTAKNKCWVEAQLAWYKAKVDAEQQAEKKIPLSSRGDNLAFSGKSNLSMIEIKNQYDAYKTAVQAAWMD